MELDPELDPEVVMRDQPTINIGTVGSVSNGKSTITEKLSHTKTQRHSKEKERNITVLLGYANAKIYQCSQCPAPQCYQPRHSKDMEATCDLCDQPMKLRRHISIVDSPGHNLLMQTMLNGTCVMDTTILVESMENNPIPAQQTREHVLATQLVGLPNSIVCLNKMDLVKRKDAPAKLDELQIFLKGTLYESSPIVPVAANHGINIDVLCQYICQINEPERDFKSPVKMIIIRSFNVNNQFSSIEDLQGAVVGGTVMRGVLRIGDRIKILPGHIEKIEGERKPDEPRWRYRPLFSKVISINTDTNDIKFATPGGLVGVKLTLDPSLATKDGLVGQTMLSDSEEGHRVFETLFVKLDIIKERQDIKLEEGTILTINHNACNSQGVIKKIKGEKAQIMMTKRPVCCQIGNYVTVSYAQNPNSPNNIIVLGRAEICDGLVSDLFRS